MTMRSLRHRIHHDERGSMVAALLAVVVVGGLMTALMSTIVAGQQATKFDQNYTQAAHAAELGMQRAVYLLERNLMTAATAPVASPAVETVNGRTATWSAVESAPGSGVWTVTSRGTDNGVSRTIQVTASGAPRFPAAVYTEVKMHLTGSRSVRSYDSATGTVNPTGNGKLRSGGSLQSAAVTSDSQLANSPKNLANDENMQFIVDKLAQCPTKPNWVSSANSGRLQLVGAGPHCFNNVTFDRNTEVIGTTAAPAIIYVTGTVEFKNKAVVKVVPSAGAVEPSPRTAAGFQLYSSGTSVLFGKGHVVTGAYYAPKADCRGNMAMPDTTIYGALVCSSLKTNGLFKVEYDDQITLIDDGVALSQWTEL